MISVNDIHKKALSFYGDYLSSKVNGEPYFPKVIRSNKKPSKKEYATLKKELIPLLDGSYDKLGYGYKVHLKPVTTSELGLQALPEQIVFEREIDYLRFVRKEKEVADFVRDTNEIVRVFPVLKDWILRNPLKVVVHKGNWNSLITVAEYFINNPRPNLYVRELPIRVHTKFVEQNRGIIEELLRILMPGALNQQGTNFEERLSLKQYEPYIHMKVLDSNIALKHFSGLTDIGITPTEAATINLPVKRVLIFENKQNYKNVENFLSLPHLAETIAIFGSGFGSGVLRKLPWLAEKDLYYWGDIDLHGFEILSCLREDFPNLKSFLMDEDTFDYFVDARVQGAVSKVKELKNLTEGESSLYRRLLQLEASNRLEQEKIPHEFVLYALDKLFLL